MTTPLERIKELDASEPIPKLPRSYRDSDPIRRKFDQAILAHRALFGQLAEDFVVQMQDTDGIPQPLLDGSPASLGRIDEHIIASDYRNAYKKAYRDEWLLPSLGGYVAHVCDVHLIEAADECLSNLYWVWGPRFRQHALQTQGGLKTFHPFAAAEAAIESGLPLATFFATARWYQADQYLTSITILPTSPSLIPDERARTIASATLRAFFPDAHVRPRFFNRATQVRKDTAMCAFEVGYLVLRNGQRERPQLTDAQRTELATIIGGDLTIVET